MIDDGLLALVMAYLNCISKVQNPECKCIGHDCCCGLFASRKIDVDVYKFEEMDIIANINLMNTQALSSSHSKTARVAGVCNDAM